MNLRVILPLCAVLALMGCAHSPSHEECSDREPASLRDTFQKQVMSYVDCGATTEKAAPALRKGFENGHETIVNGCVNDPLASRLFADDDSKASVATRVQAYCQYNPVLRFCIVCQRMHDSPPLDEAYRRCAQYLDTGTGENEHKFRDDVLTKHGPATN